MKKLEQENKQLRAEIALLQSKEKNYLNVLIPPVATELLFHCYKGTGLGVDFRDRCKEKDVIEFIDECITLASTSLFFEMGYRTTLVEPDEAPKTDRS